MPDARYNITLSPRLEQDLVQVATSLDVSKAEVLRRALVLFKYATEADKVELTHSGEKQTVLLR